MTRKPDAMPLRSSAEGAIDPEQSLACLTARVAYQLERRISRALDPTGLTLGQLTVLAAVARQPGMCSSDVARRLFISRQAANVLIIRLVSSQMLARAPGRPRHRLALELTPAGRHALRIAQPLASSAEASALGSAGEGGIESLRELLRELVGELGARLD